MKTVLSGIQPTGNLHLGNYLGSIRNWIDLQQSHRCLFGVMNLHAITLPQNPKELRQNALDAAAVYLACGLNPKKSAIFVQSEVSEHAELAWVLGCVTPMGWLNRMTQFKDKAKLLEEYADIIPVLRDGLKLSLRMNNLHKGILQSQKLIKDLQNKSGFLARMGRWAYQAQFKKMSDRNDRSMKRLISKHGNLISSTYGNVNEAIKKYEELRQHADKRIKANLGLYSYPVLMAADILLYRADLVPVGEDQKQHLELTRDIAGAFNRRFEVEYFKLPEPMILSGVKRIMSLQDGTKKMSKSDESELSRINLLDHADEIVKKVKKAKTDSQSTIAYDESRPEIYNLLNIFAAMSGEDAQAIAKKYETAGYGKFKADLAEILVEKLRPIQSELQRLKQDQAYVRSVLDEGKKHATEVAQKTKKEVFEIVGL